MTTLSNLPALTELWDFDRIAEAQRLNAEVNGHIPFHWGVLLKNLPEIIELMI